MDSNDINLVENIVSAVIEHVFTPLEIKVNEIDKKISAGKQMNDLRTQAKSDLISALNELKDQLDNKVITLDENQRLNDNEKGIVRSKIDVYSKGEINQQLNTSGANKNQVENLVKNLINKHKQGSKSSLINQDGQTKDPSRDDQSSDNN